ncbi:GAF and ANTAR domain-containing protein [Streptomyces sp. NPDC087422]|uniref:GAF and ANTAR domain-containing protein n=1 Tax=Streptomyces sp. NPDC087422 TaxID=3365786 RepID=UPI00382ACF79
MISDRMAEILRALQTSDWPDVAGEVAETLGVDGIAISAGSRPGASEVLWSSGAGARAFEDLQLTVGQGPGPDCLAGGTAVRVPDLGLTPAGRWPALLRETPALSVRAVFCFALRVGAITLGVLTLVRDAPGRLTPEQDGDAGVLAGLLTRRFLDPGDAWTPSAGRPGLSAPGMPGPALPAPALHQAVLHQATGMVSVQLAVPLAEALLRLRAYAYGNDRPLTDVARDVVARRLRMVPDPSPGQSPGTSNDPGTEQSTGTSTEPSRGPSPDPNPPSLAADKD